MCECNMSKEVGAVRISADNKATECDIVFVHGLVGDAHDTWRHLVSEESWLDWVDQDHCRAAVWTLGYEASPTAWRGRSMPIYERAKNRNCSPWVGDGLFG